MQERKYEDVDLSYSAWHRRNSTRRYVGMDKAQLLSMIDLDARLWIECDDGTKEPLAIIEIARDVGQDMKPVTITRKIAKRANLPCLVVLYHLADDPNPADPKWKDIDQFRVRRIHPNEEYEWRVLTPEEYANTLLKMRDYQANQIDW